MNKNSWLILVICMLALSTSLAAQEDEEIVIPAPEVIMVTAEPEFMEEMPLAVVETPPLHRKCSIDLDQFECQKCLVSEIEAELISKVKWPRDMDTSLAGSRAYVSLRIDTLGKVILKDSRIRPHSPELHSAFDKAVSRVKSMQPGKHRGRLVAVDLVIVFTIPEE